MWPHERAWGKKIVEGRYAIMLPHARNGCKDCQEQLRKEGIKW
jgi:hypothetical protein